MNHFMNTQRILRMKPRIKLKRKQRGAVAIEAALIIPVLILVTIGSIDVGQFINVAQMVSNASREGARIASRDVIENVEDVEDAIFTYFTDAFPKLDSATIGETIQIQITDADGVPIPDGDLSAVESGTELMITVNADFSVIRWIKGPNYFDEEFRSTTTSCRRE